MWTKAIVQHLLDPQFELQEYFNTVKRQADLVLHKGNGDQTLRQSLSIIDAKSVFDNVTKEGAVAHDKYTALEVAIARERADGLGVQVRWVEHQSMIVDGLTKVSGNPGALYKLLDSCTYRIVAETELLDARKALRSEGRSKPR